MKITKADIAGWKVETDEQTYYVGEYVHLGCNDGVVYKDKKAFETGEGVCYIQEYGFDNREQNEGELFEFSAKEAVAEEIVNNPYVASSGYTRKDFEQLVEGTKYSAHDLFLDCEWQSPETLLDEWFQNDDEEEDNFDDPRLTPQQRKDLGYD